MSTLSAYSIQSVYDKIKGAKENVSWDRVVRNRLSITKHRFIAWLEIQDKLQTTEILARIGISNTNKCLMRDANVEVVHNYFFSALLVLVDWKSRCAWA